MEIIIKTYKTCDINNPKFNETTRVHDWRNYINKNFQKIWDELPIITRFCLVIMAEEQTEFEDWD